MYHLMSRATAIALLAIATFALAANADAPSNNGAKQDKKQQNDQAGKNQNHAPSGKPAAKDSAATSQPAANDQKKAWEQKSAKKSDKNSPDQADPTQLNQNQPIQNQAIQNNSAQSNLNAATLQQNSATQSAAQINQQNGADNRQSLIAPQHSAFKSGNMRGPDIGLWFGGGTNDGLVISDVSNRGAISQFGFHEGDRIVSVNHHRVSREPEFLNYLLGGDANRAEVIVMRDGREESLFVDPNALTEGYSVSQVDPMEQLGVVLDDRYDDRILVRHVIPRSPAFYGGLRDGDVISTLGGQPFTARSEFETSVGGLQAGATNLQVLRGEKTRDLSVDVPEFDRGARNTEWHGRSENGVRRLNAWPDNPTYMNRGGDERRGGR